MSLNDPNWGRGGSRGPDGPKGPNQGPPDLDELWRNFNRRLSDMFGKRGGNRGDGPPPSRPDPARIGKRLEQTMIVLAAAQPAPP